MAVQLQVDSERLADFCRRWNITELALFGSALRSDFRSDSDVDVLVAFAPGRHHRLADLTRMEDELTLIFGRPVDLVTRPSVERSRNYVFRQQALGTRQPLYVA